jgi:hydrogenase maturation protease
MNAPRPVLVIATGNPSRGDDAIGPLLADRLEALDLPGVEVAAEFQLAPEHALDLAGRDRVIFVDAGQRTLGSCELRRVEARNDFTYTSHAMSPEAVLATYGRAVGGEPPEAWVLDVRGACFELGEPPSANARAAVEAAWPVLLAAVTADPSTAPPAPGAHGADRERV